jgi:hypothetical protein
MSTPVIAIENVEDKLNFELKISRLPWNLSYQEKVKLCLIKLCPPFT